MAKQTVSPVEQHVEKAVLGAAGVVLAGVVILFVVSTPNTVVLDGRELSPGQVDAVLKQEADELRSALLKAKYTPEPVEDYRGNLLQARQEGPVGMVAWLRGHEALPAVTEFGPPVPSVTGGPGEGEKIQLAPVLACARPEARTGRTLGVPVEPVALTLGPEGGVLLGQPSDQLNLEQLRRQLLGETGAKDLFWVSLATTFDLAAQRETMKEHGYDRARSNVLVIRFEVERQHLLGDGSWSEWEKVKTSLPVQVPAAPTVTLGPENRIPPPQYQEVASFRKLVGDNQEGICRPPFPAGEILGGEAPQLPDVPGLKNILDLTAGGRYPSGASSPYRDLSSRGLMDMRGAGRGAYEDEDKAKMVAPQRVGAPAAERGGSRGAQARPSAEAGRGVAEALKQFNSAQEAFDQGKLDEAFALAEPLKNNPDLPEAYRTRLEQLSQKITEAMEAKRKEEAQRQLERLEARQKAEREGKLEEWLEQYGLPPKAYLWAYDLTVEPGRTYRYRCRVVLYNWYLGVVSKLGDRGDAEKTELAGEWSELSEPMLVEPASYFYLSSADSQTKQARVDVFKWHFGQWVKEDFRIGVGEGIGQTRRVRLHETDGQLSARPVEVNFDTGAVAVDIEYDRPSKSLVSRGTGQFDLTSAQSSAALVYVDADGLLQERVATYDAADPTRLKLAQAVRESRTPVRVEPTGPRAPARTPEGRTPRRTPLPGARPGAANRPPAGGGYPGGERKPGE